VSKEYCTSSKVASWLAARSRMRYTCFRARRCCADEL
jgi:hypothetical protein